PDRAGSGHPLDDKSFERPDLLADRPQHSAAAVDRLKEILFVDRADRHAIAVEHRSAADHLDGEGLVRAGAQTIGMHVTAAAALRGHEVDAVAGPQVDAWQQ